MFSKTGPPFRVFIKVLVLGLLVVFVCLCFVLFCFVVALRQTPPRAHMKSQIDWAAYSSLCIWEKGRVLILENGGRKSLENRQLWVVSSSLVNFNIASCLYQSTIHYDMISQPPSLIFFALPLLHYLPKSTGVSRLAFTVLQTTPNLSGFTQ